MAVEVQAAPETAEERVASGRQRFVRNPDRVDEIVWSAMQRLHKARGNDVFRAGISQILDACDGRLKSKPSRASVYRSVERLAEAGKFTIARKGERGNFTYNFSVSAPSAPETTTKTKRGRRANTVTPITTAPVSSDLITSLVEEDRSLSAQLDALMTELAARVEAKKQKIALAQEALQSQRELVAA